MTDYVSLPYNKKLNLLREHGFSCEWPNLEHENWCLHCRRKFSGLTVRVWRDGNGSLWLECGTPGCDGSPIDWAPYPWWDPKYTEPKAQKKKSKPHRKPPPKGDASDDVPF